MEQCIIEKDILSKYACGYRKWAFSNACVREIKWSPNLKYIGDSAFCGCAFLNAEQELHMPQVLAYICASAFEGCKKVTSVVFPDSIVKIDSHAFRNCESLKWVYIPDTIKEIGSGVFDGCTSLKEIKIPKVVTQSSRSYCHFRLISL